MYSLAVCKWGFYIARVHMLWKVFIFTKNLAPAQLGESYTQWEARKLLLKFGEVFLTSVHSGIFLAYLVSPPPTSNPTIASYFFSFFTPDLFISLYHFLFPTKMPQCFLFSGYSCLYTWKTNFNSSSGFLCFSQQELLSIVIYSKQILVMASPPFLEKQLKFLLKLLEAEWQ